MKIIIISDRKKRTIRFPLGVVKMKFVTKKICEKINENNIVWEKDQFRRFVKTAYKATKKFSRSQKERFVLVDVCSEDSHIIIYL